MFTFRYVYVCVCGWWICDWWIHQKCTSARTRKNGKHSHSPNTHTHIHGCGSNGDVLLGYIYIYIIYVCASRCSGWVSVVCSCVAVRQAVVCCRCSLTPPMQSQEEQFCACRTSEETDESADAHTHILPLTLLANGTHTQTHNNDNNNSPRRYQMDSYSNCRFVVRRSCELIYISLPSGFLATVAADDLAVVGTATVGRRC